MSAFNQDTDGASGARFEGALISAALMSNGVNYAKKAVVCFDEYSNVEVPLILRSCPRYYLDRDGEYDKLYAFLTSQVIVERPPLGAIIPLRGPHSRLSQINVSSFSDLCKLLLPLMKENGRIFHDFGPNSGKETPDETPRKVRFDLGLWYKKRDEIVTNNDEIAILIKTNFDLVPIEFRDLFSRVLSHVDAFKLHCEDLGIDYREHQFPIQVVDVVRRSTGE